MKMLEERHPSSFELDVLAVGGRRADGAIGAHLEGCVRCRGYLEELAKPYDAPLARRDPAWRTPPSSLRKSSRAWGPIAIGGIVVAAAVGWLVRDAARGHEPIAYVGTKGLPSVEVLVRRDRTSVWDGHSPIHAGDAIALRVACEGFTAVTVTTPSPDKASWTKLFEGECPARIEPLGFTLVADDEPGIERVVVVLRRGPLDDQALRIAIQNAARTPDVWTLELAFPKAQGR